MIQYENEEQAKAATQAFNEEVEALRLKYGIHDMIVVTIAPYGDTHGSVGVNFVGCPDRFPGMAQLVVLEAEGYLAANDGDDSTSTIESFERVEPESVS